MRRSHTYLALALIASTTLLAGCSLNPFMSDTAIIKNPAAVAPTTSIELLKSGTPTEQVKAYTDKAKEAQAKLQLLLEEQKQKAINQKSGAIIERFIPTALAQADENATTATATDATAETTANPETAGTDAEQIAALIEEVQTYTELAIEAADDVTDPTIAAALLDEVQTTQATTADILTAAQTETTTEVATVLTDAVKEVTDSIATVDTTAAEVSSAIDSGATSVTVDVPTDVEDFVATNQPIILEKKRNPQFIAGLKLGRAAQELERLRKNLIADGVAPDDVQKIIETKRAEIEQAKQSADKGAFKEALQQVREGFQEMRQTELLANRTSDANARYAVLKTAADNGDELAKTKLAELTPLIANDQPLTERIAERKKFHEEFKKEAANMRQEFRAERQELQGEFLSAKRAEAAGEMTSAEFAAKQQELIDARKNLIEQRIEAEKGLQAERTAKFAELKNLPPEEKAKKVEELQKEFTERKDAMRNLPLTPVSDAANQSQGTEPGQKREELRGDKQELREDRGALRDARQEGREQRAEDLGKLGEAMQSGDAATIEAAKKELKDNRMSSKTERQELKDEIKSDQQEMRNDRKELKENQAGTQPGASKRPVKQPLPPTQKSEGVQDAVRDLKQDIKANQQATRESKQEVRDNKQDLKEALQSGDQGAVKEVKQGIRDERAEFKEERKENRQEIREDKKEIREERQGAAQTDTGIQQPKKPEPGQASSGERVGPGPHSGSEQRGLQGSEPGSNTPAPRSGGEEQKGPGPQSAGGQPR